MIGRAIGAAVYTRCGDGPGEHNSFGQTIHMLSRTPSLLPLDPYWRSPRRPAGSHHASPGPTRPSQPSRSQASPQRGMPAVIYGILLFLQAMSADILFTDGSGPPAHLRGAWRTSHPTSQANAWTRHRLAWKPPPSWHTTLGGWVSSSCASQASPLATFPGSSFRKWRARVGPGPEDESSGERQEGARWKAERERLGIPFIRC